MTFFIEYPSDIVDLEPSFDDFRKYLSSDTIVLFKNGDDVAFPFQIPGGHESAHSPTNDGHVLSGLAALVPGCRVCLVSTYIMLVLFMC